MVLGLSAIITTALVFMPVSRSKVATGSVVNAENWDTVAPEIILKNRVVFVKQFMFEYDKFATVRDASDLDYEVSHFKKLSNDYEADELYIYETYARNLSKLSNADLLNEYEAYKNYSMGEPGIYSAILVVRDSGKNLSAKPIIVVYNPNLKME
jgi:hypothetical protein